MNEKEVEREFPGKLERPMPWKELTIIEQVERMHQIVRAQGETIQRMNSLLWALNGQMRQHKHVGDKLMVEIDSAGLVGLNEVRVAEVEGQEYF